MIQRIQTLLMSLVVLATAIVLWKPLLSYTDDTSTYQLYAGGLNDALGEMVISTLSLTILCSIALGITLVAIFLFKKRMLQIRLNVFALVLQLGFYGLLFYLNTQIKSDTGLAIDQYKLPIILPLINAILSFLAIRAIGKDEALIRSLDRIR